MHGPAVTHPDDLELARQALHGDLTGRVRFSARMRCVPRMLSVMNRRLPHPLRVEDLEDLVQDTLVTIWRRLDTYAGMASIETWSYRFCGFQLANRLRAVGRRPRHVPLVADDPAPDALDRLLEFEDVHHALDRIDANAAAVIRLKHFEQLSFDEIGQRLDISPNTAKTRYYRSLKQLRQVLGPQRRPIERSEQNERELEL